MMKWISIVAALALLTGCVGYQGPSRGVVGDVNWRGFSGISTTARTGETPMGYREGADGSRQEMYGTFTDGPKRSTGIPAHIMAEAYLYEKKMMFCALAKNAEECGGPAE